MAKADLSERYRDYIACLNRQDWANLHEFVHADVSYNGREIGLLRYRAMLESNFREISDLRFNIELLVADARYVASRLRFDCSPKGVFLGLPVNGRRILFYENVLYEFSEGRIRHVFPVIDKAAIEAQLAP